MASRRTYQHYDLTFKIELVKLYLAGEGSVKKLTKEHGLKSTRQLRHWVKKYQDGELTEAEADKRGRSSHGKRSRPKTRFASKEEEWEYLRLENEYLKKKLLAQGESESSIANLWSSKNLK
jgi:transposase-like protein